KTGDNIQLFLRPASSGTLTAEGFDWERIRHSVTPSPASIGTARDLRVEPLHAGGDPLPPSHDVLLKRWRVGIRAIERSPAGSVSLCGVAERAHVFVDQTVNGSDGKFALAKLLPARGESLPERRVGLQAVEQAIRQPRVRPAAAGARSAARRGG